jgi:hypothetical protein
MKSKPHLEVQTPCFFLLAAVTAGLDSTTNQDGSANTGLDNTTGENGSANTGLDNTMNQNSSTNANIGGSGSCKFTEAKVFIIP